MVRSTDLISNQWRILQVLEKIHQFCDKPPQFDGNFIMLNTFFVSYPLVNIQKTMERSTMLLMGKSTISMAIFNSHVTNYQGKICD